MLIDSWLVSVESTFSVGQFSMLVDTILKTLPSETTQPWFA